MNRLRNYVLVAGALVVCSALAALPSQSSADTVLAQTADPPAAPAGLAIAAGDQSVTLTWDDPADSTITGYEYRARANLPDFSWIDWTAVSGSDASTTSMTLSGLANGIEYRFMVRAVNANGAGDSAPDGDPGYIAATPRAPPGPVGSITVTRGDGSLDASWDAVDGATSYHITYSSDGKQSWSLAALNHPDASITVSGMDNASTYIIGVRARNASGASSWTNSAPVDPYVPTPPPPAPDAPSGLTATAGDGSIIFAWNDPSDSSITGYEYQIRAAPPAAGWGAWTAIPGSGAATTSLLINGLTNGTEYRFKLRAINKGGAGAPAPVADPWFVSAVPEAPAPTPPETPPAPAAVPAAPTGLTATAGADNSSVALSWDASGDASVTGYEYQHRVVYDGSEWGSWTAIGNSDSRTASHTVTGLEGGFEHRFRLRAVNETGASEPAPEGEPGYVSAALEGGAGIASDNDTDDDGLIEVTNLAQLIAMQWDLDGDGSPTGDGGKYATAFTSGVTGCKNNTCAGYELSNDITVTANPSNAGTNYLIPGVWNTTFEGNSNEIINQDRRPLFETIGAATGSTIAEVKNLTIESKHASGSKSAVLADKVDDKGKVTKVAVIGIVKPESLATTGTEHIGGMVNEVDGGVISTSYARVVMEVTVANSPGFINLVDLSVGGLAGYVSGGSKIIASYATGDVTMKAKDSLSSCSDLNYTCSGHLFDDSGERYVGGLVGRSAGDIHAVYAMGDVIASDNFKTCCDGTTAGGLVGEVLSGGTLRAGYAIGDVTIYPGATGGNRPPDDEQYGKAVGRNAGTINDVYGSGSNPSHAFTPSGVSNKSESELEAPTAYGTGTSIYKDWNIDLDNADNDNNVTTGTDDPWNFGTNSELPTIKYGSPAETHSQQQPATFTLAASPATIYESTLGGSTRATSSTITATLAAAKTYDIIITLPAPKDAAYTYATGDSRIFTIPRNTTTESVTINAVNNQDCGTGVCGVTSNANLVQTLTPTADHNAELTGTAPTLTITDDDIMSKPSGFYISGKDNDPKLYAYWDAGTSGSPDGFYLDFKSPTDTNYSTTACAGNTPTLPCRVTITGGSKVTGDISGLTVGTTYTARLIAYKSDYENSVASDEDTGSPGGIDYDQDNDSLIEVSNLEQLNAIRHDLSAVGNQTHSVYTAAYPSAAAKMGCDGGFCDGYELTADLDFDTDGDGDVDNYDYIDLNGNGTKDTGEDLGGGWDTIDGGGSQYYSAILEGNEHEIKNLYINDTGTGTEYFGLFHGLGTGHEIRNVYLTKVSVTGASTGTGATDNVFVSALAVWNLGTISDSYVTGSVTANQSGGGGATAYAGGFVGQNLGTIRKSYSSANVTATAAGSSDAVAGGLLSWNLGGTGGTVEASYATGNVSVTGSSNASNNADAGGLVGRNAGTIRAVYATGNVSAGAGGTVDVGGLVGNNSSTITVAWSKGAPSGDDAGDNVGGLIGSNSGTVTHAYWDADVSGIAGGKTTSELQTPTEAQKTGSGATATYPSGIYSNWNVNVDGVTGNDDPWDFGTSSQYPVLHVRTLPHALLQSVPTVTWTVSDATLCESSAGSNTNACGTDSTDQTTTITPTLSAAWATDISYTIPANAAYTSNKTKLTIPAGKTTVTGATLTAVNNKVDAADNVLNLTPPSSHLRQASSVPAITIKDEDIPKPTGLRLSVYDDSVTLNIQLDWTEVSLADSYTLQQSTESDFDTKTDIDISSGSTTSKKITSGLTSGTTYYFRLIAEATGYEDSAPSDVVSATPTDDDVDYDADNDGLIEVKTLAQLNAIRWDLDGDGVGDKYNSNDDNDYTDTGEYDYTSNYTGVFMNAEDNMGCNETAAMISSNETGNPACTGYELAADLDLNASPYNTGAGWTPIGDATTGFTGEFDGTSGTYKISNLFINSTTSTGSAYAGLFGVIGTGGVVKNVRLEKVDVTAAVTSTTSTHEVYAGALAGKNSGTVSGSISLGEVAITRSGGTSAGKGYAGGLVGWNDGTIVSSYSRVEVTATSDDANEGYAGGLVALNDTSDTIAASFATGSVTATTTDTGTLTNTAHAGGLVAHNKGTVIASYAHGDGLVKGNKVARGGFAATNASGATITASFSTGSHTGTGTGTGATTASGGFTATQSGTVNNSYWDTDTSGIADDTDNAAPEGKTTSELQTPTTETGIYSAWDVNVGGTSANDDPWDFGTATQYPVIDYGLTAADQRAAVTVAFSPTIICESSAGTNASACGTAVTSSTMTATLSPAQEVPITLTFSTNAAVYTLSATTITIAAGATSGTLTVTAVNNKVDASNASVTQTPTTGPNWVSITGATLTIKDDDLPKPTGLKASVHGVNVQLDWTAAADATGYTVQWSTSSTFAGTPSSDTVTTNTWKKTTGFTSGTTYYFRVIATATGYENSQPSDVVNVTPTAGTVDYDNDNNGLIGVDTLRKLNAIRWDLDGDGVADDPNNQSKYDLAFPNAEDNMGCNETAATISSTGNPPCRGYELTKSLDFDTNGNDKADSGDNYWNSGKGWQPIADMHTGTSRANDDNAFTAEFNGKDFVIYNLYIKREAEIVGAAGGNPQKVYEYAGLFGDLGDDAKVSDLKLEDVWLDFQGPSASNPLPHVYAGGLAGRSAGTITGVSITGIIRGVALSASGSAKPPTVGGLVGYHDGGTITASYAASADVVADQEDAENNTKAYAGGLVGYNKSGTIQASHSAGTATATILPALQTNSGIGYGAYAGGLVGYHEAGDIISSYSYSVPTAVNENATTFNFAKPILTAGGLVGGQAGGNVTASYSTGAPTTDKGGATHVTENKGGLVGWRTAGTTTDSYWDSTVSGITGTGQGEAKTTSQIQTPTAYGTGSSIYANWNLDIDNADDDDNAATGKDDQWDFGTTSEYPVLKYTDMPANAATQRIVLGQVTGVAASWSSTNNVTVSWTAVTGADRYKVQWRQSGGADAAYSVTRQKVATGQSTVTINISTTDGMTIGETYHVQVIAAKAAVLDGDPSTEVSINVGQDYDADDDGMIEVKSLAQLNAIRWDLDADGVASSGNETSYTGDTGAFPKAAEGMGCNEDETASADQVCTGYELGANLDFNTNGSETSAAPTPRARTPATPTTTAARAGTPLAA